MSKTNPAFLNGVPELLVLKLLSRKEMYGYEIVKAIQLQTKEQISFGEGCIYPYLHHLEAPSLRRTSVRRPADKLRFYSRSISPSSQARANVQ